MKRPKGVTAIAVFFLVSAMALPAFVLLSPRKDVPAFAKFFLILVSLIEFALAMGLWKMKNWARMSTLVLVTVGFISAAASLRHIPVLPGLILWLWWTKYVLVFGIDLSILIYLISPKVRQAFLKIEHA
jgi:hypothetical protein